ncbi:hypothetical protein [Sphingomonas trueperi]|uniref:hypothetical protein n=1 Tax=Sphingomonas trueperi TaxID=53317 RepID=UPI000F0D73AF
MSDASREMTIFYAWQSDSPPATNRNAIRTALTLAAADVEAKRPGVTLRIDEATRDMLGADNVPDSIRSKIEAADVFIGDVSVVTSACPEGDKMRPCPNPNVTFEVGYAAAHLGWKRLILLLNVAFSRFEDLPFDFDRQRVSSYKIASATDRSGSQNLRSLLATALTAILDRPPQRPAELKAVDPSEIRTRRDIENATWALEQLHIPIVESHIEALPHVVETGALHFYHNYLGVIDNGLFHINDPELDAPFRSLADAWRRALLPSSNYHTNSGGNAIFSSPGDAPLTPDQQKDWDDILAAREEMAAHLSRLLDVVRKKYVTIELKETNRVAFQTWQREKAAFKSKYEMEVDRT